MYIDSITMEGWKTYQFPITISKFDPSFNAISGHNGSGKSNILDAVQFVLGCNDRQLMRIKHTLTELIYKDGTAGITHASVTIKFNMKARKSRPAGYEDCESLAVTRTIYRDKPGKYHINGSVISGDQVRKMFYSLNLNVENPHFIVKQGQITKIVLMKPAGVLSMIEQAVGTGSYIKTRQETMDIIRKNDVKLSQMNMLVESYIIPRINRISTEKQLHSIVKNKESQFKIQNEKVFAYGFLKIQQKIDALKFPVENGDGLLKQKKQAMQSLKQQLSTKIHDRMVAETALTDIKNLQSALDQVKNACQIKQIEYQQCSRRINNLREETNKVEAETQPLHSKIQSCRRTNEECERKQMQLRKEIASIKQKLIDFNGNINKQDIKEVLSREVKDYQQKLKQFQAGLSKLQNKERNLQNQLVKAEAKEKQYKSSRENAVKTIQSLKKEIQNLKTIQKPREVRDPESSEQNNKKRSLLNELNKLIEKSPNLKLKFMNPPVPNFKRQNVKGRLFDIFTIKDPQHYKAIEIGVGGRLHNIAVLDDTTSSQCLINGVFGNNVSVIPNNKIGYRTLSKQLLANLQRIGKENGGFAKPAYDLLDYDPELQPTIKFAFATFVVVSSKLIGKAIAFHPNKSLRIKCVTLDGDTMDPQGTLSGGYTGNINFMLLKVIQLRKIERELEEIEQGSKGLFNQYREYQNLIRSYGNAKKQLDLKVFQLQRLQKQAKYTSEQSQILNMSKELQDLQVEKNRTKVQIESTKLKLNTTIGNMKNSKNSVEDQRKVLETDIKNQQKQLRDLQKYADTIGTELEQLTFQLNVNKRTLSQNKLNIDDVQKDLTVIQSKVEQFKMQIRGLEQQISLKSSGFEKQKLDQMVGSFSFMQTKLKQLRIQVARDEQELKSKKIEYEEIVKKKYKILEQHPWLPEKLRQSELSLNDYPADFNYQKQKQLLSTLEIELASLKKRIVVDSNSSDERIQKAYTDLKVKIEQMHKDKQTLLQTIKELDDRRIYTLKQSCQQVGDNFKKIFMDMYPISAATAELVMVDENEILKGFELGMSENGIMKSMCELSGGQKSLLSLAFILGLLLYRPCPFYFLDEIDAALDEVHTENIGVMISERFPQSQFIIISLKESMFRNANILYNICFINGKSNVTRTDNKGEIENEKAEQRRNKKAVTKLQKQSGQFNKINK